MAPPITVGIIGLSASADAWAAAAHSTPLTTAPLNEKFKLVAVGTSSAETAKAAAEAYGLPLDKAYSDAEAMAADKDVELVVVSVKTPLHKQLALPALHAKKAVLVEWPLGNGLQEAEELAALAKKQGVKTAVGLQGRFLPSVQKAKEIIGSGALGRITGTTLLTSGSMRLHLTSRNRYINDPSNGANLETIATVHSLDPLCYLLGEFRSLTATTGIAFPTMRFVQPDGSLTAAEKSNISDSVSINGVLESGASVSFTLSSTTEATPSRTEWIISGEQGSLKFQGSSQFLAMGTHALYRYAAPEGTGGGAAPGWSGSRRGEWEEVEVEEGTFGGMGGVYRAFAEGDGDLMDFEQAVKRHRMVEAIFKSAKDGTRESY